MKNFSLKDLAASLINEAEKNEKKVEFEDSLDAQVDKFLISYEKDSKVVKKESFDFRDSMRSVLYEAEGDEEEKDKDADAESPTPQLNAEDIDMESFVNNVMRLVENYDSLLEVRDTILKRALNFVAKNYKKDAQRNFEDTILDLYGVKIGSSKQDIDDEYYPSPRAAAAGPGGGGG